MSKKIIFIIAAILLLPCSAFFLYLNYVFLPVKVKTVLTQRLHTYLDKDVTIEKINYNPFKGVTIENLKIFDRKQEKDYLEVKKISFNFLFFPIFKEKKVIIPLLRSEGIRVHLTLRPDRRLNALDILEKVSTFQKKSRYQFLIYKAVFSNGGCLFRDDSTQPAFTKEVTDLKIGAQFSLPHQIIFLIEGKIPYPSDKNVSSFNLSGSYDLTQELAAAKLKFNQLPLNEYSTYLKNLPLSLFGFVEDADLEINFLKDRQCALKGKIALKDLALKKENYSMVANLSIEPELGYDFLNKKFTYQAIFKITEGQFSGLKYLQKVSALKGEINLVENKVWSERLTGEVFDSPCELNGILENFSALSLKLKITSSQLNLEKLSGLLPFLAHQVNLSGTSTLQMDVSGALNQPLDYQANGQIITAELKIPYLKEPFSGIKGKISFAPDSFIWEDLSFLYKERALQSAGKLTDFHQPEVNLTLASPELKLNTALNLRQDNINIKSLSGSYLNSQFKLHGDIATDNPQNPLIDLAFNADVALNEIIDFFPKGIAQNLKQLKSKGICTLSGYLKGRVKNKRDWVITLDAASPALSLYGLKLENLAMKLNQKNKNLTIHPAQANFYSGKINLNINSNLEALNPSCNAKVSLVNVDLAKLKEDSMLKDKELSGIINLDADLKSSMKDLRDLSGSGFVSVKEARFWQLNLFKGMGEIFFIPAYEKISFKKAEANFILEDHNILTEDAYLESDKLNLLCKGKVGFDGSLDLEMNSEINEALLRDSADLRKFTSAVFGNLLTIKVKGTLNKPEYKSYIPTKEVLKGIKRFFLGR